MVHTVQGKEVGDIGYGLMGLTWTTRTFTDEQMFAAMKTALECGANYWNGGEFYGPPENNSLTLLNKYFEKYPEDADKVVINIKGCMTFDGHNIKCASSPQGVQNSIDNCLKLLGPRGRMHQFEAARKDPNVDIEVTMKAFEEHIRRRQIGGISLSEVGAATIRRAAKVAKIEAVEVELSLFNTAPLYNGIVEACAENGIPILAYSPLGRGILTGRIQKYEDMPEDSHMRRLGRYQHDVLDKNLRLVREIEVLARKKGYTPAQIAINWLLALSKRPDMPIIIPIPGATTPERIRENTTLVELSEADLVFIDRIIKELAPIGARYMGRSEDFIDG